MINPMGKKQKAFTLVELLVVIAIIGLLATISVIALNDARAKARDAKRVADVKQMQTAVEMYFNDKGYYPPEDMMNATTSPAYLGSIYSTSTAGTSTYMAIIPTAPNPADGACLADENTYTYLRSLSGGSYRIDFCLGGNVGALAGGLESGTPAGFVPLAQGQFIDEAMANIGVTYTAGGEIFLSRTRLDGRFYVLAKAGQDGQARRRALLAGVLAFDIGGVRLGRNISLAEAFNNTIDRRIFEVFPTILAGAASNVITAESVDIAQILQSVKTVSGGKASVRDDTHALVRAYASAHAITSSGGNGAALVAAAARSLVPLNDAKAAMAASLATHGLAIDDRD
jgi:general secretion pathway protein G